MVTEIAAYVRNPVPWHRVKNVCAVLAIFGLFATPFVFVNVVGTGCESREDTAQTQAQQIAASLDVYKMQHGEYPSTLDALTQGPRPIMDRLPRDPWSNEYALRCPGVHNTRKCDVISKGGDGKRFTKDDIGNWPREGT